MDVRMWTQGMTGVDRRFECEVAIWVDEFSSGSQVSEIVQVERSVDLWVMSL